MVVGVLAMLFIVGSTLIIVARFERQTSDKLTAGQNMDAIFQAVMEPIQSQLREDVVGIDDVPYNRAWNVAETSQIEDAADFPGTVRANPLNTTPTAKYLAYVLAFARSGDALLSSSEPARDGSGNWFYPWVSSGLDVAPSGAKPAIAFIDEALAQLENLYNNTVALPVKETQAPMGEKDIRGYTLDSDGDGLRDMGNSGILGQTAKMFGPGYNVAQRVLAHGGMVLIDPFTHPLLLAQVIHPEDTVYHNDPSRLWTNPGLVVSSADEGGLRRRFILPKNLGSNLSALPDTDLRKKLPVTTGYEAASGADQNIIKDLTPHWWPVDSSIPGLANDAKWWKAILTPPALGLTEAGYNAARDTYSRRQLITTANSDDLLRVQRDEGQLADPAKTRFQEGGVNVFNAILRPSSGVADIGSSLPPISMPALPVPQRRLDANLVYVPGVPFDPSNATGTGSYSRRYFSYGRDDDDALRFNVQELRTPFSLRDVLDPYTGLGTYQKFEQLTAYYLAMIQHTNLEDADGDPTTLNDSEQLDQLETAAQLAINTIDFADDDDLDPSDVYDPVSTYVEWPESGPQVTLCGVEKQPYITEAYVKLIVKAKAGGGGSAEWDKDISTPPNDLSIYAVELYNPYDRAISLHGYRLSVVPATAIGPGGSIAQDLGDFIRNYPGASGYALQGAIGPGAYMVFANKLADFATGNDFIPPYNPATGIGASDGLNFFAVGKDLHIDQGAGIALLRTESRILRLTPDGFRFPAAGIEVEVDELTVARALNGLGDNDWAGIPIADINFTGSAWEVNMDDWPAPQSTSDLFVRDSSLQRHKERTQTSPGVYPPRYWHFTLSLQGQFPPAAYESRFNDINASAMAKGALPKNQLFPPGTPAQYDQIGYPLSFTKDRPLQHNLLGVSNNGPAVVPPAPSPAGIDNQALLAAEFLGTGFAETAAYSVVPPYHITLDCKSGDPFTAVPVGCAHDAIVSFPVVTADRGIDPLTGGTLAFPTTGTLLLVTRYAHMNRWERDKNGNLTGSNETVNVSALATSLPPGVPHLSRTVFTQLVQPDNGHMPIFDRPIRNADGSLSFIAQGCTDLDNPNFPDMGPQGRLDVPWGQLVYEYFTALPLEELTRRYNYPGLDAVYSAIFGVNPQFASFNWAGAGLNSANTRLIDLPSTWYEAVYSTLFKYYPLVDPDEGAMTAKNSKIGPKVRGRINVNMAPWWVLDGLPVLPMGVVGTDGAIPKASVDAAGSRRPTSGVPLAEVASDRLDPLAYLTGTAPHEPAAFIFMNGKTGGEMGIFDPGNAGATKAIEYFPSVSPKLARYMTSYAQGQPVYGPAGTPIDAGHNVPGFVTPGNLCELMLVIPVTVTTLNTDGISVSKTMTLGELRNELGQQVSGGPVTKPYAYLGYLQMVAPLVRLQDWVTVKNHVFTIYATVGDTSDAQMPIWMRSQLTVDRTNCLYQAGELPRKIIETPAIAYQNAVDDK